MWQVFPISFNPGLPKSRPFPAYLIRSLTLLEFDQAPKITGSLLIRHTNSSVSQSNTGFSHGPAGPASSEEYGINGAYAQAVNSRSNQAPILLHSDDAAAPWRSHCLILYLNLNLTLGRSRMIFYSDHLCFLVCVLYLDPKHLVPSQPSKL